MYFLIIKIFYNLVFINEINMLIRRFNIKNYQVGGVNENEGKYIGRDEKYRANIYELPNGERLNILDEEEIKPFKFGDNYKRYKKHYESRYGGYENYVKNLIGENGEGSSAYLMGELFNTNRDDYDNYVLESYANKINKYHKPLKGESRADFLNRIGKMYGPEGKQAMQKHYYGIGFGDRIANGLTAVFAPEVVRTNEGGKYTDDEVDEMNNDKVVTALNGFSVLSPSHFVMGLANPNLSAGEVLAGRHTSASPILASTLIDLVDIPVGGLVNKLGKGVLKGGANVGKLFTKGVKTTWNNVPYKAKYQILNGAQNIISRYDPEMYKGVGGKLTDLIMDYNHKRFGLIPDVNSRVSKELSTMDNIISNQQKSEFLTDNNIVDFSKYSKSNIKDEYRIKGLLNPKNNRASIQLGLDLKKTNSKLHKSNIETSIVPPIVRKNIKEDIDFFDNYLKQNANKYRYDNNNTGIYSNIPLKVNGKPIKEYLLEQKARDMEKLVRRVGAIKDPKLRTHMERMVRLTDNPILYEGINFKAMNDPKIFREEFEKLYKSHYTTVRGVKNY